MMIKPLELLIGLRYTRSKRRNQFISFISATSMVGIVLGVWALITAMSIMNGFQKELRQRILFAASHVTVSDYAGRLSDWTTLQDALAVNSEIEALAPYVLGQGMLTRGSRVSGVLLRGIDPQREKNVSEVLNHIVQGNATGLTSGSFKIVLGDQLARELGVTVGDKVTLVAPGGTVTPAGLLPRTKRFTVSGIFQLNMYEYDNGVALINIDDARRLLKTGDDISGIRLKLQDVDRAPVVNNQIYADLKGEYRVRDWTQEHASFFRALKIEKRVVFIALTLIVAVAAFNIVSTLVMIVTDKQSDIAILRTLGMSPSGIMKIFIVQGSVIGIIGTILGGILGVWTAVNVDTLVPAIESFFNTKLFPIDVYVITDFPAELRGNDVVSILVASVVLCFLSTIYPAWRASKVQPAEALRYE